MQVHRSIEGIPVIIRFKTLSPLTFNAYMFGRGIEGIPVIIRFKTKLSDLELRVKKSIEGIPVIIRFKTE